MALVQTLASAGPMAAGGSSAASLAESPPSTSSPPAADTPPAAQPEEEPVIDIVINNVVSSFSVSCHLDLKHIAQNGHNVEYRRENGVRVTLTRRIILSTL